MTESHPEQQPTDTRADEVSQDLADDRDVPTPKGDRPQQDAVDAAVQAENAGTSLDQPSQ
ncbi:hypothetical protein GHK92_09440 [Nocardioides sp. dk4132]|uniref:hypothetical protein n=1 Tax=unclassified Nocardioides TaxID=2615069 RepID=UPI001297D6A0|nr:MULTISPECIES: hypothetical protein [unclassified Nocardioides]MQW76098.1 hypothetical protein [Nocardioides sp. dk4132]QGA08943.1 hypothetical protein GFH29_17195 [Nocardioides sp. dk884]